MINTENVNNDYLGNGATVTYGYTFQILDQTQIAVVVRTLDNLSTTLVLGVDYTVSGVGDVGGGSVTLLSNHQLWIDNSGFLATGVALTLTRAIPLEQTTDIRNQGDFLPEIHETAFDKVVMMIQQLNFSLRRSLKASITDYTGSLELPPAATRANKTLGFDNSGNPVAISATLGTATVSSFMQTVLAAGTAAATRTLLGFLGAGSTVATALIEDLAVATTKLADLAVTTAKLAANAVTTAKLDVGLILGMTTVTIAKDDYVAISDTSDSGKIKKGLVSDLRTSSVRAVAAIDSATATDEYLTFSGASFTETLPDATLAVNKGRTIQMRHAGTSLTQTYSVTAVAGNVAGSGTTALHTNGEVLTVKCDGTDWIKVSRYIPPIKTAYTPTGTWLTNCAYTGNWQRIGKRAHIEILITLSGAPTSASLTAAIPANMTIDSSAVLSSGSIMAGIPIGIGQAYDLSAVAAYSALVKYFDTGNVSHYNAAIEVATTQASPVTFATGDLVYFSFDVPILNWND